MADERKPQKEQKGDELGIVRLAGRDIKGSYSIIGALMQIKGFGYNMARDLALSVEKMHGIKVGTKIGTLSEEQMGLIEQLMKDPAKAGIPPYMLNRRKDLETGADMHVIGTDLTVYVKQDIDRDIRNQTWRGFRHMYGQRVRGQRTRSTGRTGATVGVTKSKVEAAAKPAQPSGKQGAPGAAPAAAPSGQAPAAKPAEKPAPK
ncbi:MAG: 30S ribosomal protein S13 [Candidatus Micrarchaeaceae archaeon]